MTRVTLIGSSHAAAMRHGWDALGDAHAVGQRDGRGIDLRWFVAAESKQRAMRLSADKLYGAINGDEVDARTRKALIAKSGDIKVDLKEADVVLLLGVEAAPDFALNLGTGCTVDGLGGCGPTRLSRPAFDAMLARHLDTALPGPGWRGWDSPRVLVALCPRRAETALAKRGITSTGGLAAILDHVELSVANRLADQGLTLIRQPRDTLTETGMTRQAYCEGSARFMQGNAHDSTDTRHMNAAYGALMWQEILKEIA